jgi:hypothetical protein
MALKLKYTGGLQITEKFKVIHKWINECKLEVKLLRSIGTLVKPFDLPNIL